MDASLSSKRVLLSRRRVESDLVSAKNGPMKTGDQPVHPTNEQVKDGTDQIEATSLRQTGQTPQSRDNHLCLEVLGPIEVPVLVATPVVDSGDRNLSCAVEGSNIGTCRREGSDDVGKRCADLLEKRTGPSQDVGSAAPVIRQTPTRKTFPNRRGFRNGGNTSFANALLQEFLEMPFDWLDAESRCAAPSGGLVSAIWEVFALSHFATSLPASSLLRSRRTVLGDGRQHDVHELFLWCMQEWHSESCDQPVLIPDFDSTVTGTQMAWMDVAVDEPSQVTAVFQGLCKTSLSCRKCGFSRDTYCPV